MPVSTSVVVVGAITVVGGMLCALDHVPHADNVLSAPISKQLRIVELLIMKERWAIRTKLSSCT